MKQRVQIRIRKPQVAAWEQVYSAPLSPALCINCHTATNYPNRAMTVIARLANVIRGRVVAACPHRGRATCHRIERRQHRCSKGGRTRHLAPLSMRWQDLNDRPLSKQYVIERSTERWLPAPVDSADDAHLASCDGATPRQVEVAEAAPEARQLADDQVPENGPCRAGGGRDSNSR